MRVVIDPGHGGRLDRGKSTAAGARGPAGTLERDVTLGIARALARELGSAARLTRAADDNPALAERSAAARASGAAVFVSLHANAGPPAARGAEVWIHDRAGARSLTLGRSIAAALGGTLQRGPLAVLAPDALGAQAAACLVEVDYLSHPEVERVLASRGGQARAARAIAGAIVAHEHGRRFGAPPTFVDRDADGLLWIPGQPDWEVGFVDAAGTARVGVFEGQPVQALSLATVGVLTTGDKPNGDGIVLVEEVGLTPNPAGGAAPGLTRFDLAFTGRRAGWTWIGRAAIMTPSGRSFTPIDPARLAPAMTAILDERARIDLHGREEPWVWMSFSLADEAADTARWVEPGHGSSDFATATAAIDAELPNLPAGSASLQNATWYRNILIGVSVTEGGFGATSGAGDTTGSLGIFQWGMEKGQSAESGSLGMFFRDLSRRAVAAAALAAPGLEDRLFIDAWAQCTGAGLSLVGNQIFIGGGAAEGQVVEATMQPQMAAGRLRTYQLVAAVDWIEQFRDTVIRPGPSVGNFARVAGNSYDQTDGPGLRATVKLGASTIEVDATQHRTVGELMGSMKALATAITLGVNRPHFVEAAAWKVMSPPTAAADITSALRDLADELTNHGANPLPLRVTRAMVAASTPAARLAYLAVETLIWPLGLPDPADEWRTVADFRRHALKFYKASDARTFRRWERFSTLEMLTW